MARPKKEINWEIVEKRMEAGCSGVEIAAVLRIQDDTFYRRFEEQYGKSFQDSKGSFHSAGDSNIKFTQYMKALSGNIPMLMYLGKIKCGQRETDSPITSAPNQLQLDQAHRIMELENELIEEKNKHAHNKSETE